MDYHHHQIIKQMCYRTLALYLSVYALRSKQLDPSRGVDVESVSSVWDQQLQWVKEYSTSLLKISTFIRI